MGTVSPMDVQHGLADMGVNVSLEDVNLFFQKHDKDRDGRLDVREFSNALTPQDPYFATMLSRRPGTNRRINQYRKDDIFGYSTGRAFLDMMRTLINSEGREEVTRQDLSRNPYFDPSEAFRNMDVNRNGVVS